MLKTKVRLLPEDFAACDELLLLENKGALLPHLMVRVNYPEPLSLSPSEIEANGRKHDAGQTRLEIFCSFRFKNCLVVNER